MRFEENQWHVIEFRARQSQRTLQVTLNGMEVFTEPFFMDPYLNTTATVDANTSGWKLDVRRWELSLDD